MIPKERIETAEGIDPQPSPFESSRGPVGPPPRQRDLQQTPPAGDPYTAARGFGQIFGIHPALAFLTLVIDSMLFGGEVVSLGMSLPFSMAVATVLGFIAYRAQMKWYGDDKESAMIKALILALLTAIPTALPSFVYVPAGIVGFVHNLRKKS